MFLLHLLTVVVGFGSAFVYPVLGKQAAARGGVQAQALSESTLAAANRLTTPVIYAAGATGLVLVMMSEHIDFDEAWISIALVLFVAAAALVTFAHAPNLKRMDELTRELASGPAADAPGGGGAPPQAAELAQRGRRAALFGGILHLLFLAIMIDMIWKPGSIFT